jgi:hypothetical protein
MDTVHDPYLTVDSVTQQINGFFSKRAGVYPKFDPTAVTVQKNSYSYNISCTIRLSEDGILSPRYPDATEVYITNTWRYPQVTMMGDARPDVPSRCIVNGENILGQDGVPATVDDVSDLVRCLEYLFPTDPDSAAFMARKQQEQQARDQAALKRVGDQRRARMIIRAKIIPIVVSDMKDRLRNTEFQGYASLLDACNKLNVDVGDVFTSAWNRTPMSLSCIAEALDRIIARTQPSTRG